MALAQLQSYRPTVVDLFCGAGGLSHGLEQLGFRVIGGVDSDRDSLATFAANHEGSKALASDLAKTSPESLAKWAELATGDLDCLVGGPPCQGFSRNRAFRHQNGAFVDDPRNHLYQHFFKFVEHLQPKIVVIENVPEILIKSGGYFGDAVSESFQRLGYEVDAKVLNAAEYGVPQHRRRAFFIAGRDGLKVSLPDPTTRLGPRPGRRTPNSPDTAVSARQSGDQLSMFALPTGPTVWDAIGDLFGRYAVSISSHTDYAAPPTTLYQADRRRGLVGVRNHFPWQLSDRQLQRIRLLRQGEGQLHLPKELQTANGYGSAYRRMQADAQALTITTWMFHPGSGMFTHPEDDRVITIREAARLQSFQDGFVFHGKYHSQCRQVGNAVAPLVAQAVGQQVLLALGRTSDLQCVSADIP